MFYYDWTMILIIPGLLLGLWAQFKVKSAYAKYRKTGTQRGITAEQVARDLLARDGNTGVAIEPISGELTDNYDPNANILHLSQGVYGSGSIAAIGIANLTNFVLSLASKKNPVNAAPAKKYPLQGNNGNLLTGCSAKYEPIIVGNTVNGSQFQTVGAKINIASEKTANIYFKYLINTYRKKGAKCAQKGEKLG